MFWQALGLCLALTSALAAARAHDEREELRFAPLPLENPDLSLARNLGLARLLGELLQREVQIALYPTYSAVLEALALDEIDLAELGPLPALLARERVPELEGIASFREADGSADYRCVIVAAMDGVPSLSTLSERIATGGEDPAHKPGLMLTRPESTCGPTTALELLRQASIPIASLRAAYRGTHETVALSVLRDPGSIGAVKDSMALRYAALGLHILATSDPVPGFALFALPTRISPAARAALARDLQALSTARRDALDNGRAGFSPFDAAQHVRIARLRERSKPLLLQLRVSIRASTAR